MGESMTGEPIESIDSLCREDSVFGEGRPVITADPVDTGPSGWWKKGGGLKNNYHASNVSSVKSNPTVKWSVNVDTSREPIISEGVIYLGTASNEIYAYNLEDGTEIWKSSFDPSGVAYPPAVVGDAVYLPSDSGYVHSFDKSDGSLIWEVGPHSYLSDGLSVNNGIVYCSGFDGLYALNASDGSEIWTYSDVSQGHPVVSNGVVYTPSDEGFFALNASDGSEIWSIANDSITTAALNNNILYAGDISQESLAVHSLDTQDGTELWLNNSSDFEGQPSVANGIVYNIDYDGVLYALDASNGDVLWTQSLSDTPGVPVSIADGVVYSGGGPTGDVYAFNASDGSELWSLSLGSNTNYVIPMDDYLVVSNLQQNMWVITEGG